MAQYKKGRTMAILSKEEQRAANICKELGYQWQDMTKEKKAVILWALGDRTEHELDQAIKMVKDIQGGK